MNIFKKYQPIYKRRDGAAAATHAAEGHVPGARSRDAHGRGGPERRHARASANTSPDVNVDQILASLDTDTRNYLLLLLSGGAQAFHEPRAQRARRPAQRGRATCGARSSASRRSTARHETFTRLLAQRQRNIRRSIHNLQVVTKSLGGVNGQLTSLIKSSNTNFSAISSQDANLQQALTLLPGTLQQTTTTLGKVETFSNAERDRRCTR